MLLIWLSAELLTLLKSVDVVLFTHEEGATVDATVFNRNIDAATTDVAGIVELATVAETFCRYSAGDRAITPASFAGSQYATDIAQQPC